jgi:RNA polymerase sigma factor (sigma-70 family)
MITLQTWQTPVTKEMEENQFTKIVKNWTPHLLFTAWKITKNKQVAEDIVQEAFLVLWKQQARIIPANPVGWLIKVVTNLSAKYVKQKNIQIRIHNTLREGETSSYFDVEEYLLVKEKRILLNETFKQLPSQQKIVLHLSKDIGLRREEIAACLQLSPNTVKVHLQRAMQFMKEHLTCIVIISMLFVCNNIFLERSNTKDELRELYMTGSMLLNETTQVTTFLLKQ